jgi:hypothetical protein
MFTNPMLHAQQTIGSFVQLASEQAVRMSEYSAQLGELHGKMIDRAFMSFDESARLMKESLGASAKLADEWRRLSVESGKKIAESMRSASTSSPAS